MNPLNVDLGARSYPIYIGRGLLGRADLVTPFVKGRQVMIVTNETIAPLYLEKTAQAFAAHNCKQVILPDGEQYKTLEVLNKIYDALLANHFDRGCTLVALGGGVIGDMTGFAAASYQRGVNFIQIPTTLLSQVYFFDEEHIAEWLSLSKTDDGVEQYLEKYVYGADEFKDYLELIGGSKKLAQLKRIEKLEEPMSAPWIKKSNGKQKTKEEYSSTEMLACVASNTLDDKKSVYVGTGLPMIAAKLAKRTHAPNLLLFFEAGGIGPEIPVLPISVGDSRTFYMAVAASSMHDSMLMAQAGYSDYGFLGAAQIDIHGNINTTVIGPYEHPKVRLPGRGGANDVGTLCNKTIAVRAHGRELEAKSRETWEVRKIGRTHLQDAVPIRLGEVFLGYAGQMERGLGRLAAAREELSEVAIGGTAVGTGIATDPEFARRVCRRLSERLSVPLRETTNHFQAQATLDAVVGASGAVRTLVLSLRKIADDIRWMASGPRCGLGEIALPEVQPGSSIMPGKVNPVVAESLLQACARALGADAAIVHCGCGSNFELNTMLPLATHEIVESVEVLGAATGNFAGRCVRGIAATGRGPELLKRSLALATALVPLVGYDEAAAIAKEAAATGRTIREIAAERGIGDIPR